MQDSQQKQLIMALDMICGIKDKLDKVFALLKTVLGMNTEENYDKIAINPVGPEFTINIVPEIEEFDNFEQILEVLNQIGDKMEYNFKKG